MEGTRVEAAPMAERVKAERRQRGRGGARCGNLGGAVGEGTGCSGDAAQRRGAAARTAPTSRWRGAAEARRHRVESAQRRVDLSADKAKNGALPRFGGVPATTLLPYSSSERGLTSPAEATTCLFLCAAAALDPASPPGRSAAGSDLAREATHRRKEETIFRPLTPRYNGRSLVEARRVSVGVLERVLTAFLGGWPAAFAKRTAEEISAASLSSFAVSSHPHEMKVQADAVKDWSELPLDVLALVFAKLGAVEVLMGAGLVCQSWIEAAKVPTLWRYIDMEHHEVLRGKKKKTKDVLCAMAKMAVDRSNGGLEVFAGTEFVTDELLKYIAERSASLKSLSLDYCNVSNEAFTELIIKLPLLEELLISLCPFVDGDAYEVTSRACAQLKRLMLRQGPYGGQREGPLGIETMHELRYLTLVRSDITTEELVAIIDGCPHLERLCVRNCSNIVVDGALRAKCSKIKTLILPTLQHMRRFHVHPDDAVFTDKFDDWRSA